MSSPCSVGLYVGTLLRGTEPLEGTEMWLLQLFATKSAVSALGLTLAPGGVPTGMLRGTYDADSGDLTLQALNK
jgi:hypothetical protein